MGESTVDPPKSEDKMGGVGALEVSVSFGRFENDSLSWDKWSSFSQNKYLEEVEKCSTPGSVAMKKAYFEAHYKKVAAKKALMDQQAQMESENLKSDMPNDDVESEVCNTPKDQYFTDEVIQKTPNGAVELETSNDQCLFEEIIQNTPNGAVELETSNDQCLIEEIIEKNLNDVVESEISSSNDQCFSEEIIEKSPNGDVEARIHTSNAQCFTEEIMEKPNLISEDNNISVDSSAMDSESCSVEQKKDLDSKPNSPCSVKPEKDRLVDKTSSISIQDDAKVRKEFNNGQKQDPKVKKENLNLSSKSKKVTAIAKERNTARMTKKTPSPLLKAPQISTPRMSKPTLTPSPVPVSRSSTQKGTNSSTQKSKNLFSTGERRRVAPSSLHMSLSLDHPRDLNLSSPATTRKSMIMEKMGDKDIVKRAFKTFQNNVNQFNSSRDEISSFPNQVQRKEIELKVSSSTTPRKDERSYKTGSIEGKSTKTVSSLKTNDRTETRKKLVKKLDEKSSTKEADKTNIQSKLKDLKETEIKKIRQSLNFKATPLPYFYRRQEFSKTLLNKDGSDNGTNR